MRTLRFFALLLLVSSVGCNGPPRNIPEMDPDGTCEFGRSVDRDASSPATKPTYRVGNGALLVTRFESFEEFRTIIQIEFNSDKTISDSTGNWNTMVRLRHCSNGREVISELRSGISQGDINDARRGDIWDRLGLVFRSPYAVINRIDLGRVWILARRRGDLFGEGDVAFYDLALMAVKNINTEDLAYRHARDSSEKGYINSFNHITAQALITSCFSEELADFVADAHERYHHPELITGMFTEDQIEDLEEGPVDNYIDLINNEWGQELGKQLKQKYGLSRDTWWTPELMADYLNDLQSYYSWAFQIGFKPVRPEDEEVIRFADKINVSMM